MPEPNTPSGEVDQFILEQIDSVPHLEALLLIWRTRPKSWSINEMAKSLYVPAELAENILRDLAQRNLIEEVTKSPREYHYLSSRDQDRLIALVDTTYRRELIRISRMIHARAPSALREFARAFRFTREKDKEKE
ncbi:MAG TPA: hypothetical protein VLW06_00440 [Terriglobales bacterium]|nr:hypothetical protein [Terriglobales bacterium]